MKKSFEKIENFEKSLKPSLTYHRIIGKHTRHGFDRFDCGSSSFTMGVADFVAIYPVGGGNLKSDIYVMEGYCIYA